MKNYENFFPIMYVIGSILLLGAAANAMVGPVDGTAGVIAYDGDATTTYDFNWDDEAIKSMVTSAGYELRGSVEPGENYPCDPEIQLSKCRNSLTPLSGTSSSMPLGWYWDGVLGTILAVAMLAVTALVQNRIKSMRAEVRKDSSDSTEDNQEDDSGEEDSVNDDDPESAVDQEDEVEQVESEDEEEDEEPELDDSESEDEEELEDEDDSEEEEDDDEESEDDDEVDIGDRVGVVIDGEDMWGEIVDFDGDDNVIVLLEENDEEVTVDWDDLFLDED